MLSRSPGGFMAHHDSWVTTSGIDVSARAVHEHRVACRTLQFALDIDALNIKNLACLEFLNRRRQLIEEAHKDDASRPSYDGAVHFMGEEGDGRGAVPFLKDCAAAEIGMDADTARVKRKIQEALSALAGEKPKAEL